MLTTLKQKTLFKITLTVSLLFLVIATLVLTMSSVLSYWRNGVAPIPSTQGQTTQEIKPFYPLELVNYPNSTEPNPSPIPYNVRFTKIIKRDNKYYIPAYDGQYLPEATGYANWGRYNRMSKFYNINQMYKKDEYTMYKSSSGEYKVFVLRGNQPSLWGYWNLLSDEPTDGYYFRRLRNLQITASPSSGTLPEKNYNIVFTNWNAYYPGDIVYSASDELFYMAIRTYSSVATTRYLLNPAHGLFDMSNINKPPMFHNSGENKFWQQIRYFNLGVIGRFRTNEVVVTTKIISGVNQLKYYKYIGEDNRRLVFENANINNPTLFEPYINQNEIREW